MQGQHQHQLQHQYQAAQFLGVKGAFSADEHSALSDDGSPVSPLSVPHSPGHHHRMSGTFASAVGMSSDAVTPTTSFAQENEMNDLVSFLGEIMPTDFNPFPYEYDALSFENDDMVRRG